LHIQNDLYMPWCFNHYVFVRELKGVFFIIIIIFWIRDINWPRHCIRADVGGTSAHIPHSRGRLISQLLKWLNFGLGDRDREVWVRLWEWCACILYFRLLIFVWMECFWVVTNLLLLGSVVVANAITCLEAALIFFCLCSHLPPNMVQLLAPLQQFHVCKHGMQHQCRVGKNSSYFKITVCFIYSP
jgi:hypothetical protein